MDTCATSEAGDFARQYDPQWFHADPEAAKESTFGEVIASGVQLLAIWRQLDHGINSDIDFVCGVGFDDYRMKTALRAGDRVKVRSETDVRSKAGAVTSGSRPGRRRRRA